MVLFGRSSDRSGERRVHFAVASLLGAAGIVASNLYRENTLAAMIGLSVATDGSRIGQSGATTGSTGKRVFQLNRRPFAAHSPMQEAVFFIYLRPN
jgi:hypothetical protein